ncbi:ABC transporter [Spiroplasma poulsonii]|uniref:ABC transporter n=1 Tax=Spiroplasma poulsonii TaxID=2138 RepID=UPI001F5436CC|nr:ABC transporter [Spiroplasma poulsonii]
MSFLYGIICITGVWDPVANISKVPMAIVNRDDATCVAYVNSKGGTEFIDNAVKVGYLEAKSSEECNGQASKWYQSEGFDPNKYELNYRYSSLVDSVITNNNKYDENSKTLTTSIGDIATTIKYLKETETSFTPNSKYWVQLKIPTDYSLNTYKLMRGLAQIGEPNFTDDDENNFFKTMDYFSANKMKFWATYEHSFMIGNMINMLQAGFGSLANSILATLAPETMFWLASRQDHGESSNGGGSSHFGEYYIIPKNMYNFIMAVVQNISTYDCDGKVCQGPKPNEPSNLYKALQHLKQNNPKLYESVNKMFGHIKNDVMISVGGIIELKMADILPLAFQIMFPDLGSPKDNDPRWEQRVYFSDYKTKLLSVTQYFLNNLSKSTSVNKHIQGYEFGTYGYGLGLYFISISLWIGAITQAFIYRKKSYTPNAKWYQHYFSKWFTMLITSYAQTILLFLGLLAVGYGKLGSPIVYMLMWMIVTATVLTTITQALWYSMPDDNVGRFLSIIYTVFNLTAGGGSFPVILQNGFFQAISYIVPFKYTIFGMSNIVYGIASNEGIISMYNNEILGCFGALLIFLAVFLGIDLGTAYIYRRIEMFGTFSLKEIYETMDNIDATKEFVRSRRVINNLSVEYALLIKKYIDEKHREQKIKDLEDKINSLYKDPAVVRIKKLEAMIEMYRNRFEIIKQKYVILVQKAEITNDSYDIRKSQRLKEKLETLGEKIKAARKEIEMLKTNPNYERILKLREQFDNLKDEYNFATRTINDNSSKLKLRKVYTLRQQLTYIQNKIDELNSNTKKTVFDNPRDKKNNKLIVQ